MLQLAFLPTLKEKTPFWSNFNKYSPLNIFESPMTLQKLCKFK